MSDRETQHIGRLDREQALFGVEHPLAIAGTPSIAAKPRAIDGSGS